jgi:ATP/maltotriose-dependent transcriptional regulator MalT
MTPVSSSGANRVVGRGNELSQLDAFIDDVTDGPAVLLLEGESGIGKTTLWRRGMTTAAKRGWRVLSTRPAESEAKLSYAGLADLLEASGDELQTLPDPQRNALEVALLRAEPQEGASDARVVSAAVLTVLRQAVGAGPVLIAIDDVQWLDPSTASALGFAVRRLESERIGLLLARREAGAALPFGLSRAYPGDRVTRIHLEPLSIGDLGAVLHVRLGATLPRPTLKRLHEMSGGNPFFALEIARAELRGERRPTRAALPVPRSLRDDLLRDRLRALPSATREALLYASASPRPMVALVGKAVGSKNVEKDLSPAIEAGIVETEGGELRFMHPLYGSAIYAEASRDHRHQVHRWLAEVVENPEERARHLALAADGPDHQAAAALEEAADRARARGAPAAAAELCELAIRLTAPESVSDARRLRLAAADYLSLAGDSESGLRLLEPVVPSAPPGPERADALFHLGRLRFQLDDARGASEALAGALLEAGVPSSRLSAIHAYRAWAVSWLGDLREAEQHAEEAVRLAELDDDPTALADALSTLIWMRGALGKGIPRSLMERALKFEGVIQPLFAGDRPSAVHAGQLVWAGDLDEARTILVRLLDEAITKGDEDSIGGLHSRLGGVELLAGNWEASHVHITETILRASHPDDKLASIAFLEACLGDSQAAMADANRALNLRTDDVFIEILARSALGFVELSVGNAAAANEHLTEAWRLHQSWGIGEPAMFTFPADHVEALIELGRYAEAVEVVDWVEERGRALDRPWALAVAARYRAMLAAAAGNFPSAFAALDDALIQHERLSMPFELGRTLLVLGGIRRRAKQKRPARVVLEEALAIFERLGAPLWVDKARAELARIGGRRSTAGQLTEAETRAAKLAAAGRTNREIADALFMSVRTVEGHLSHAYAKLGVRSRTELALFFDETEQSPPS